MEQSNLTLEEVKNCFCFGASALCVGKIRNRVMTVTGDILTDHLNGTVKNR